MEIYSHCFTDEKGNLCYHDCLDGHLLVDGEILNITWKDGSQESVQIRLKTTTTNDYITEFGGIWHGAKYHEITSYSVVDRENCESVFLRFADDVKIERVNAPLGKQIIKK